MSTLNNFPAHWRKAIDSRDASATSFADAADAISFFVATNSCFLDLTDVQKASVVALRERFADESLEANMRRGKAEDSAARFIGNVSNAPPTLERLRPEIASIEAEIAKMKSAPPSSSRRRARDPANRTLHPAWEKFGAEHPGFFRSDEPPAAA
ncbi:hypothetical protein [Mesorhizobium sp.]|uniref:hypothetical protein n=1 Tax=Mesorhizobium sp. TaxID=1871066 RepID=UPI000FE5B669|nr:hypothetical protein [Mesorhizobium sp.]RWE03851.1 MAG: hypothetical protein EOS40_01670 [Mesorhizobium sp.]